MLSRTAANLYWMSRYLERAENLARVLDVSQSLALLKRSTHSDDMSAPLRLTDSEAEFTARHGEEINARTLWAFLGFSGHPASIHHCLHQARENADAVRGALTGALLLAAVCSQRRKVVGL